MTHSDCLSSAPERGLFPRGGACAIKRAAALLLCAALTAGLCGCGRRAAPDTALDTSAPAGDSPIQTEPLPETVDTPVQAQPGRVLYGADTGNPNTYTGYDPLPEVTFSVEDPENSAGLSTEKIAHSYGVAKNGEPAQTSKDNQKLYAQYGGVTLDTGGEKVIYLTFDCGYENGYTEKILDVLKEKQVPAAFFVTRPYVESSPEIVARMIREGHIVGNHSDRHPDFSTISRTRMAQEIQTVDNLLRTKFGYSSPYFRFPEGACSISALELVQSIGYTSVFWSSAYADWDPDNQKGADYAYQTVLDRLHPGCVQLLHAVSKDNAEALGRIIDSARSQGYTFRSLEEYAG